MAVRFEASPVNFSIQMQTWQELSEEVFIQEFSAEIRVFPEVKRNLIAQSHTHIEKCTHVVQSMTHHRPDRRNSAVRQFSTEAGQSCISTKKIGLKGWNSSLRMQRLAIADSLRSAHTKEITQACLLPCHHPQKQVCSFRMNMQTANSSSIQLSTFMLQGREPCLTKIRWQLVQSCFQKETHHSKASHCSAYQFLNHCHSMSMWASIHTWMQSWLLKYGERLCCTSHTPHTAQLC